MTDEWSQSDYGEINTYLSMKNILKNMFTLLNRTTKLTLFTLQQKYTYPTFIIV